MSCVLVFGACFGTVNGLTLGTSRLTYAAGRKGHLPAFFGKVKPERMTPIAALLLHGGVSSCFVVVGKFEFLMMFIGMANCGWFLVSLPLSISRVH